MKIIKLFEKSIMIFFALMLLACGGGGGGSSQSSSMTITSASSSSDMSAQSSAASSSAVSGNFTAITALYGAQHEQDQSYLYIGPDGKITAYNYLGDGYDAGDNCYRVAIEGDVNYLVSGKYVTHNVEGSYYTVNADQFRSFVWWIAESGDRIDAVSVVRGGDIENATRTWLSYGTSSISGRHSLSSQLAFGVTLEDIESSICQ